MKTIFTNERFILIMYQPMGGQTFITGRIEFLVILLHSVTPQTHR